MEQRVPVALRRRKIGGKMREVGESVPEALQSKNLRALFGRGILGWPEDAEGRQKKRRLREEPKTPLTHKQLARSTSAPVSEPQVPSENVEVLEGTSEEVEAVSELQTAVSEPSDVVEGHRCDICGGEFASAQGLKSHKTRKHG